MNSETEPRPLRIGFTEPPEERLTALFPVGQYTVAPLDDCDVAFYGSILWAHPRVEATLEALSARYQSLKTKLIVVLVDDFEGFYPKVKNLWLLRTSLRRSKRKPYETVIPYFWSTPNEPFPVLLPEEHPTVAFCGLVSKYRKKLIAVMEKDRRIVTHFIKRETFGGHEITDRDPSLDFYANMRENVFNLCNRGAGNFSIRFYQTLAAGRIPVLVNTDIELPFADEIPWSTFCIIGKSERGCASALVEAHRLGRTSEMQRQAVRIFDQYFRGTKFFEHFFQRVRKA
jgi:hypothetical protein